jgi:hypothetical protein
MATKKRRDQIGKIVDGVETLARRLGTTIRKQAVALPKDLEVMANRLRKQAAHAAAQVEKYVHELRVELEGPPKRGGRAKGRARR